jgi:WhiB family redox-sensing transcriptional regulator
MTAVHRDDWTVHAKCRGMEDALFPEASDQKRAKVVCSGCPVRLECLAEALDNRIEWGVWGGMTERERRALLRRRPNVTSWSRLLQTAMEDHGAAVSTANAAQSVPA